MKKTLRTNKFPWIVFVTLAALTAIILIFKLYVNTPTQTTNQPVNSPLPSANSSTSYYPESLPPDPCGTLPDKVYAAIEPVEQDNFAQLSGPFWSPNCANITWGVWQSTFPNLATNEGLFLFDITSDRIKKVYTPQDSKDFSETIEVKGWESDMNIIFTKDGRGKIYKYNVITRTVFDL